MKIYTQLSIEIGQSEKRKHKISNPLEFNKLRARLSDLSYAYSGSPIDHSDFLLLREHFQALKSLRANNDIFITKPDKGSGVVILNKKDYIKKMEAILHDKEKFAKLGDVETQDKTAKLERKIQKRLLELVNSKVLATEIYDRIRNPRALNDHKCMASLKYTSRTSHLDPSCL